MSGHSAETDAGPSWMSAEATALYERAEALAEQRGCVIENDCWIECIDAAIEEVNSVTSPAECDGCLCPTEHDGDYGSSGHAGPCPPHTCDFPPVEGRDS